MSTHIMVDIETLDTEQSAVVLSIGAVAFDPVTGLLGEKFYVEMTDDLTTQQKLGRTISADTVKWWISQGALAKQVFTEDPKVENNRMPTTHALIEFDRFIERCGGGKNIQLWGNGSDFDNVIIGSLYASFQMKKPWSYSKNRCYRTKKAENPQVPLKREGTHHNALDDAITQALHLIEIYKCTTPQSSASTASPEAAKTP
jgi:hypothetical protein